MIAVAGRTVRPGRIACDGMSKILLPSVPTRASSLVSEERSGVGADDLNSMERQSPPVIGCSSFGLVNLRGGSRLLHLQSDDIRAGPYSSTLSGDVDERRMVGSTR